MTRHDHHARAPACLALAAALPALLAVGACSRDQNRGSKNQRSRHSMKFPVEVEKVAARQVAYQVSATGSVDAFERIQITARVAGAVEKVSFREGEDVKAGQVLVEIEPARFKLAADAARAALAKATSARADAESALARREAANKEHPGLIPAEELETFRTRAQAAAADAEAQRVALARAKLDLHDAYVRPPRGGVIQSRTVETGQYVQPGTVLATLIDRDPLLLRFQVTEADARRIATGGAARFHVTDDAHGYGARIVHVAESADPASRMVAVTAEVTDPARGQAQPRRVRRGHGAGGHAPPGPGHPRDRGAPVGTGLSGLRGRWRGGSRARAQAGPAHRRRPGRGARRPRGRRPAGGARGRGAERRRPGPHREDRRHRRGRRQRRPSRTTEPTR